MPRRAPRSLRGHTIAPRTPGAKRYDAAAHWTRSLNGDGADTLKITDVEVIKWNPGVGKNFIFVKLSTDAGITGWGEAYTQSDRDIQVEAHIDQLARYLVDRDPFHIRPFMHVAHEAFATKTSPMDLPCAASGDGAFRTQSKSLVKVPSQEMVNSFLPPYDRAEKQLHPDNTITIAPQANEDWLMEMRRQNDMAMRQARGVIIEAYEDFNAKFGRSGEPFIERYMMDDAEIALVGMGTLAMPVRVAVRKMREQGKKVGFVRVRWFRPFPTIELQDVLGRVHAVGVIDRDYSFGSAFHSGVLATEVRSALYPMENPPKIISFIAGLGGREVNADNVIEMADMAFDAAGGGDINDQDTHWIGVRE